MPPAQHPFADFSMRSSTSSQDAMPLPWSQTPQEQVFLDTVPVSTSDSLPIASHMPSTIAKNGTPRGKQRRGRGRYVSGQSSGQSTQAGSSSGRDYSRWDKKRDSDGLTPEACLVAWIAEEGNWRKWKDAKSTGHKDRCFISINDHLQDEGFEVRTKDSIHAKIRLLEDSLKKALTWINSTGAGSYSLEPDEDGDGRSPYQRELDKRCKYYDQLLRAFGERAGMIPKRLYSTIESQRSQEVENDIMCALNLRKWDFEENDERDQEHDGDDEDVQTAAQATSTPTARGRSLSTSGRSSGGTRVSKQGGIFKAEDISSYLASKGATEKRRLDIEEKKLRIQSKKARLEDIALLMQAGASLEDAKRTWDEDRSEHETAEED